MRVHLTRTAPLLLLAACVSSSRGGVNDISFDMSLDRPAVPGGIPHSISILAEPEDPGGHDLSVDGVSFGRVRSGDRIEVTEEASVLVNGSPRFGIHRVIVSHAHEPERQVELFWTAPPGQGPWPAILYVHGHQPGPDKPGARRYVDRGYLQAAADRGLLAAVVSLPGYGGSDGPADFCGPRSQGAVATALTWLREQPLVHPRRVVLYGYSRGATVAAMVATRDDRLAGVILGAGTYDVGARYATMGEGRVDAGMKANIEREAGTSADAFAARSALVADTPIRVPTLILHGEQDENCPVDQARQLAARLEAAATPTTLVVFPDTGHGIPSTASAPFEQAFLKRTVLDG